MREGQGTGAWDVNRGESSQVGKMNDKIRKERDWVFILFICCFVNCFFNYYFTFNKNLLCSITILPFHLK